MTEGAVTAASSADAGGRLAAVPPAAPDSPVLPRYVSGTKAPGWWGIIMLIVIEAAVFATYIASYFYLRTLAAEWPPDGISPPSLTLPTINAFILYLSVIPMFWGERAIFRGDVTRTKIGLAVSFVMGFVFLVLKLYEYSDLDYTWATNAYASIVWTITGFHIAHVMAMLLKSGTIQVLLWKGFFDAQRHVAIETNALYWYFVAGVWVPLFLVLYIAPRLL